MKYFLFALLITLSLIVDAQDTLNVDKKSTATSDNKKPHQDMLLVDLNWDRLIGLQAPVKQKWYGRGISVALMYDYPLNRNGNVSFAIGGGFTSHNYYTNALVVKNTALNAMEFQVQPANIKDRGKISLNYVDVPVEFRFRTNEDNREHRWKLVVGGRVGYRVNVHEKIIDNKDFKIKLYDYPQTALFRYGPTLRFGYGAIMLTGYYSISTFFQSGKALKDMNALSLGLTVSPF